jgi:hypothetical protein
LQAGQNANKHSWFGNLYEDKLAEAKLAREQLRVSSARGGELEEGGLKGELGVCELKHGESKLGAT